MSVMRKTILFSFLVLSLVILPFGASATFIQPTSPTPAPALTRLVVQPIPVIPVVTTQAPAVTLAIDSVPSGAQVTIDGIAAGQTPYTSGTLSAGSHNLVLSKADYADYTATFTISPALQTRLSYTLNQVPATTTPIQVAPVTTESPVRIPVITATITPKATTPVPSVQLSGAKLSEQLKLPVPSSIKPVTIQIGSHTKTPRLTTLSPYFSYQLENPAAGGSIPRAPDVTSIPTSYIEVDSHNVYLPGSHVMSSVEMALDPVWGDEDTVPVRATDTFFNNTNFRWLSAESGVTAFYQVSRYPFDSNASHWQNQYVPGLVASGPAKEIHLDSENFHYFSLNFAPIANHNPGDPPFYTGIARLDESVPGKGITEGLTRIPLTGIGIYTKEATIGPLTLPVPAGFTMIPAGNLVENELGNPNENMYLSTGASFSTHVPSALESAILDTPQTFYVRIVPIHKDGTAGIPTMPVTVTAVRPKPCPPKPPANAENDIVIKPPSGTVSSFYMTSFIPDWIHTDQNGKLVSRAYFMTVATPPSCSAAASGNPVIDNLNVQQCAMYGGGQIGYHFYADPAASHWYDTAWDIITGLFGAWAQVLHAVSVAWNEIQNLVVEEYALMIRIYSFDTFKCDQYSWCTDMIRTGLDIAETSLGIPPTIPDVSELESMGADYMAKCAAEELGAGGALDTAKDLYGSVPSDLKQGIENQAGEISSGISDSLVAHSASATATAANNWYIPDPLYYQAHPAMVMVKVSNPNTVATDPVYVTVSDSAGLFKPSKQTYVPALKPYDSTVIPMVLEEDYTKVYTPDCNADAYTSECGDICVPCYWNKWYFAVIDSSKNGGDTFSVSFSGKKNGYYLNSLTPSSSGTVLSSNTIMNFDEQGQSCGAYNAKTVLKYPDTWKMQAGGLKQDLWSLCWLKFSFTEGDHGRLIGG